MSENASLTALVTGASSGLGFEAAAQLGERGYKTVIVTARNEAKASATQDGLTARTGLDIFETLVLDNDRLASVEEAANELARRGEKIDVLILNAGVAPNKDLVKTEDGLEATVSSTLVGHHLLTARLMEKGLLGSQARIVIAGSEAARGDVPTFHPADIAEFAAEHFEDDLEAAIEALIRMDTPAVYDPSDVYATAKMFVAWWAAELARRLPAGMTVNAVSPGSTPGTDIVRNAPFYMKYIMLPILKLIPGMAHSVEEGGGRYLEAIDYDNDVSGGFYASKPKKMTGPLVRIQMDHLDNRAGQAALWSVTGRLAGAVETPVSS